MKIYLATSFKAKARARAVMQRLREAGHEIVGDWTEHKSTKDLQVLARESMKDWNGLRDADVLIILWDERQYNTLVEFGITLGLGRFIYIVQDRKGNPDKIKVLYANHPLVSIVPAVSDLPMLNGRMR